MGIHPHPPAALDIFRVFSAQKKLAPSAFRPFGGRANNWSGVVLDRDSASDSHGENPAGIFPHGFDGKKLFDGPGGAHVEFKGCFAFVPR
jgi:hypothetical protein